MRDHALQAAGVIAIVIAIAHGIIGERQVFACTRIDQPRTRFLLRMVGQATTVDWVAIGVLLIVSPHFESAFARTCIVAAAVVVYGYAAIGNALATRRLHVGWLGMAGSVALALYGI